MAGLWEWSFQPLCALSPPGHAWPLTDSNSLESCMLCAANASKAFYNPQTVQPKCIMGVCSSSTIFNAHRPRGHLSVPLMFPGNIPHTPFQGQGRFVTARISTRTISCELVGRRTICSLCLVKRFPTAAGPSSPTGLRQLTRWK